ncbi:MAG TPA: ATP-binding cassette domain-containing protein [Elusimicrobiota bacterium]|nr:ATP-binding cassette domain-containing protein [Elusimicrobiota bacterium]
MPAAIEIADLRYRYPQGHQALDGISLRVQEGERVAIIGPNGAGKSTLFLHLNGVLGGEGSIVVFGRPLNSHTLYDIRRDVGLVFQDPNDQLFMPTVFEDVAFGPVNLGLSEVDVRQRVHDALAAVGMEKTDPLAPHHLSLGQRKKVALAGVLALSPRLLAIDEPSDGLDPASRRSLIRFLGGLPQTLIIATHDLDLVLDLCHRAIILDNGRVVADEAVPDIFRDDRRLEAHGLEKPLSWSRRD